MAIFQAQGAITLIACICMFVGMFCAHSILCKCGVLFICARATPNAYHQINERLHTFFFIQTCRKGVETAHKQHYMNKKKNEGVQSRREFFKRAAKTALPILGAVLLASNPIVAKAAETPMGCMGCSNGCTATCRGTCSSTCTGSCIDGCKSSCKTTCKYTCAGRCTASAY